MILVVRIVMSAFIVLLVIVAALGWFWTTHHQIATQALASHIVLGTSALAAIGGLFSIWHGPHDVTHAAEATDQPHRA